MKKNDEEEEEGSTPSEPTTTIEESSAPIIDVVKGGGEGHVAVPSSSTTSAASVSIHKPQMKDSILDSTTTGTETPAARSMTDTQPQHTTTARTRVPRHQRRGPRPPQPSAAAAPAATGDSNSTESPTPINGTTTTTTTSTTSQRERAAAAKMEAFGILPVASSRTDSQHSNYSSVHSCGSSFSSIGGEFSSELSATAKQAQGSAVGDDMIRHQRTLFSSADDDNQSASLPPPAVGGSSTPNALDSTASTETPAARSMTDPQPHHTTTARTRVPRHQRRRPRTPQPSAAATKDSNFSESTSPINGTTTTAATSTTSQRERAAAAKMEAFGILPVASSRTDSQHSSYSSVHSSGSSFSSIGGEFSSELSATAQLAQGSAVGDDMIRHQRTLFSSADDDNQSASLPPPAVGVSPTPNAAVAPSARLGSLETPPLTDQIEEGLSSKLSPAAVQQQQQQQHAEAEGHIMNQLRQVNRKSAPPLTATAAALVHTEEGEDSQQQRTKAKSLTNSPSKSLSIPSEYQRHSSNTNGKYPMNHPPVVGQERPGAYPVQHRALGEIPVWSRPIASTSSSSHHPSSSPSAGPVVSRTSCTIIRDLHPDISTEETTEDEEVVVVVSDEDEENEEASRRQNNDGALDAEIVEEIDLDREVTQLIEERTVCATSVKLSRGESLRLHTATWSKCAVLVVVLIVLVGVVGMALGLILRSKTNHQLTKALMTDGPTMSPTISTMAVKMEAARELFLPLSGFMAFLDQSSPQSKALQWMVQEEDTSHLLLRSHQNTTLLSGLIERYVMTLLYFAMDGPSWKLQLDFLSNSSICDWPLNDGSNGISCNDKGSVVKIELDSNNLNGTLPLELSALSSLEFLSITDNPLHGTLPESFGNLTRLKVLQITDSQLGGSIPKSFSKLRKLEMLNLFKNELTGSIPTGLLQSSSLEKFALSYNFLTGPIPNASSFEEMRTIFLEFNFLTGSIPESFYSSKLEFLSLWENSLSGTLSEQLIGTLDELWYLDVDTNNMTGTIPSEIGMLSNLEDLYLNANSFSGTIPSEMGLLTRLDYLWLDENQLSGIVPAELLALSTKSIRFFTNNLEGSLGLVCNQTTLFTQVEADCGGLDPPIDCPCCTKCCDPSSGECKANAHAVCEVDQSAFDDPNGRYYHEPAGTVCECANDLNMNMSLSCADTQCQSCNKNETVCSINDNYHVGYNPDGSWNNFQSTFQYVVGRNDTVTLDILFLNDVAESCQVAVNGQECNSCDWFVCGDGFETLGVRCENVEGAGFVDLCDQNHPHADGPLAVFLLQDPALLSGCPLRIHTY